MYPPGTLVRETTGADVVAVSTEDVVMASLEDSEDDGGDEDGRPNVAVGVADAVEEAVDVGAASVLVASTAGAVEEASFEAGVV